MVNMVVYLDVIILENFIVNTFLILVTGQTLKIREKGIYIYIAGFLGSLYSITMLFPNLKIFTTLIFKILIAFIMIFVAFRKKNIIFNFKATGILMVYSMVLAGVCIFIQFNEGNINTFSGFIVNFSYKKLLIAIMILYLIGNRLISFIRERKITDILIYTVEIIVGENRKSVKVFLDTGNELREPVTNLPVMILEKDALKDANIKMDNTFNIPFKVVNGNYNMLKGFKPDCINLFNNDVYLKSEDIIIALCDNKLSRDNDYQGLLPRGILE